MKYTKKIVLNKSKTVLKSEPKTSVHPTKRAATGALQKSTEKGWTDKWISIYT